MKKKRIIAILCSMMLAVQGITPAAAAELTVYEEAAADVTVAAEQAEPAEDAVAIDEGNLFVEAPEEASEYVPQDDMLAEEEAIGQESIEEVPELNGALEAEENETLPADILEEELISEDILAAEEADLLIPEDAIAGESDDVLEEAPAEEGELSEFPEEDASDFDDPALAGAADASGTCGDNLSWSLTGGTLTITGTGKMTDFSQGRAPWDAYTDKITAVSIGEEVTSIGDYAFYFCRNLPEIVIPDSVTYIGDYAFQKCSALKDVKIGDGVTSIGSYAFTECAKIENVEFGDNLKTIGYDAFYQCVNLKSIVLPNTLTSIGYEAFSGCTGLTSMVIEEGVVKTNIGSYAFSGCTGLKSIVIPEGVTSLYSNAFDGCSGLVSAELPDTLTSLSNSVFRDCTSLKSVKLGQNMTSIGYYAFSGCSSLTDITLPDSMITIYYDAFYGCSSLTEINIPVGVTTIGSEAFANCSSLTNITLPYTVSSLGYLAFSKCTSLTSVSLGDRLLSLPSGLFAGCTSLTEIEIPYSVTTLGEGNGYSGYDDEGNYYYVEGIFQNCTSLTTVTLGNRLQNIPRYAFSGCTSLNNLEIPDSVTTIGYDAFYGCSSLTELQIPDSVESIGTYAFSNCTGLTKINIPDGVETLAERVFSECSSLTDITLGTGLTSVEKYAFYACSGLPVINIPDKVETIGEYAFNNCSSLSEITYGAGLTSIGKYAFSGCNSLGEITFGDKLTTIGRYAFSDCTGLSKITFGAGAMSIGYYAFSGCSSLSEIAFGAGLTSIGNYAFNGCSSLGELTFGDKLTNIGECSFYGCSGISKITLGAELTSIGSSAFSGCSSVEEITFGDKLISIGVDAFYNCSSLKELTLPDSVTEIGQEVFADCASLETVKLSENLTLIPNNAFYGCTSLESITIPEGITKMENYVFNQCNILQEVIFTGDSPTFNSDVFWGANVIVYYPWANTTWEWARAASMYGVKQFVGLPSSLTLNKYETTLLPHGTEQIEVSDLVEGDEVVSWTSNNEYVAGVDENGLITANRAGTATITVKLLTGRTADVKVTVLSPTITVNPTSLRLSVFGSQKIEVSNLVEGDKVVSWTSSNENVATVDEEGLVTAKHSGSTYITVKLLSGIEAEVEVYVEPPSITLNPTSLRLSVFGTQKIEVSNLVEGDKAVSWTSSNENIATVDEEGLVTAKHSGSTYITVKLLSGIERRVEVYVEPPTITLNPTSLRLSVFGSQKIEVSNLVEGDKVVSWTSFNENIATVDEEGLVTAKRSGSTYITVKLLSGYERRVDVIVEYPRFRLNTTSLNLQVSGTATISVEECVEGDEVVSFKSEDSTIAEVDSDGKVTAKKSGSTTITVTMKSGITAQVHVYVQHPPVRWSIEPSNVLAIGGKAKLVVEGLLEGEKAIFSVGDSSIASIDANGNITALAEGSTPISVAFDYSGQGGSSSGGILLKVIDPMIIFASDSITLKAGETKKIRVGVASGDEVRSFTSANPRVASVDSRGNVTGVSAGKTKVTVTLRSGLSGDVDITVEGGTPFKQFNDVTDPSAFYYDAVYWAVDKGITTGYNDNTFRPLAKCHRAAVVTFLWRLAGRPEPESMATFTDMTGNSDFDKAISWASQSGITTGYKEDNTFRPYQPCNRAAIVTFLWRYAGSPKPNKMATFKDMTKNSDFDKAISWAYEKGITTGYAGNLFKPWDTCNRMAVVTFLYRLAN